MAFLARYFKFAERDTNIVTETRAGITTFMVMAYIIFLNGSILLGGIAAAKLPIGPTDAVAYAAATALVAGRTGGRRVSIVPHDHA